MKQRNTRRGRIVLIVLAAVLVLLGMLAYWQRENIKAFITFATHSREELEQQMQQTDQTIKDAVEADSNITVREITEEEREALRNGTLTLEQLQERLKRPYEPLPQAPEQPAEPETPVTPETPVEPEQPAEQEKPAEPTEPVQSSEEEEYQAKLNDILARVYVLREEFVLKLDDLQKEATGAFQKIKGDKSKLKDFIFSYMDKATAMEKECNAKMDAIVVDLTALQTEYGKDLSLVDTVAYTYANEKSLKKAWYMNELQRRGLI